MAHTEEPSHQQSGPHGGSDALAQHHQRPFQAPDRKRRVKKSQLAHPWPVKQLAVATAAMAARGAKIPAEARDSSAAKRLGEGA